MNSVLRKSAALLAALLLAASALSGCFKIQKIDNGTPDPISDPIADPAPPDAPETEAPDVKPAPVTIDYELLESALAIGLTGNGESYLRDPNGLWHVVGLYAALVGRTESRTPWLSDAACDALVRCLLPDDTFTVHAEGGGGQSFGAFIPKGLTIRLRACRCRSSGF